MEASNPSSDPRYVLGVCAHNEYRIYAQPSTLKMEGNTALQYSYFILGESEIEYCPSFYYFKSFQDLIEAPPGGMSIADIAAQKSPSGRAVFIADRLTPEVVAMETWLHLPLTYQIYARRSLEEIAAGSQLSEQIQDPEFRKKLLEYCPTYWRGQAFIEGDNAIWCHESGNQPRRRVICCPRPLHDSGRNSGVERLWVSRGPESHPSRAYLRELFYPPEEELSPYQRQLFESLLFRFAAIEMLEAVLKNPLVPTGEGESCPLFPG